MAFRYMSVVKYSMSGKHGLEMTDVVGSVERKKLPARIAAGCGERRSVGFWSETVGVFQLKLFQRDRVSLVSKEQGEGTERNEHSLVWTKQQQNKKQQRHTNRHTYCPLSWSVSH